MVGSEGGGIRSFSGDTRIENSLLSENVADLYGGGIIHLHGNLTIDHSTVEKNTSVIGAGMEIEGTNTNVVVTKSTISRNQARDSGGGISISYGAMTISQSTFSGNTAGDYSGGGIFVGNSGLTITVTHSTFSANTSSGGASDGITSIGHVLLKNTIMADNLTCWNNTRASSQGYNLFASLPGSCNLELKPGDLSGVSPNLAPLGDYRGPTLTHALLPGSPAMDAGTCVDIEGNLFASDQRGASFRGECDIGAYEYGGTITSLTSSANPSFVGQPVTFMVSVAKGDDGTLNGGVVLLDGTQVLITGALDNLGQAAWTFTGLPPGVHPLTATYPGDSIFAPSTSDPILQEIWMGLFLPAIQGNGG